MSKLEKWTDDEDYNLHHYEEIIQENRESFEAMVDALIGIRDERLYRKNHATFSEYCQKRWKLTARWANKLIENEVAIREIEDGNRSSHDSDRINTDVLRGSSEKAKSELTKTKPSKRAKVAKEAIKESGGKPPTQEQMRNARNKVDHKSVEHVAEDLKKQRGRTITKHPFPNYSDPKTPRGGLLGCYVDKPQPEPKLGAPVRPQLEPGQAVTDGLTASMFVESYYQKNKVMLNSLPNKSPREIFDLVIKALEGA